MKSTKRKAAVITHYETKRSVYVKYCTRGVFRHYQNRAEQLWHVYLRHQS